jgi:hypothetical protein
VNKAYGSSGLIVEGRFRMGPCLEGIWRSSNLTSLTSGMSAITCSIVCLPLPFEGLGGVESIAEMRKTARLRDCDAAKIERTYLVHSKTLPWYYFDESYWCDDPCRSPPGEWSWSQ